MKRLPIALAVAAFALVGATGAFATDPKIDGIAVTQTVIASATTQQRDSATTAWPARRSADLNADDPAHVTQTVNADDNTNTASGNGSEACQAFGRSALARALCSK